MKRYRIIYWNNDRSKPSYLIQLSKSGKRDGERISFWPDGQKICQDNWKNQSLNRFRKEWWMNSENRHFQNWEKEKAQGIKISFK